MTDANLVLLAWALASCPEASFPPQITVPAGGAVDRDGHLDLAVTNFNPGGGPNSVAILLGDGRGALGAPARFDADGLADVASGPRRSRTKGARP